MAAAFLLPLLLAVGAARADAPVVRLGPAVGGGALVGGVAELQVSRVTFIEAQLGFRPGVSLSTRIYPNGMAGLGAHMQFGEKKLQNGGFLTVGSTLPLGFFESWVAGGWSARIWSRKRQWALTLAAGPAGWIVRDLPPETDLRLPVWIYARVGMQFGLGAGRGG